MDEIIKELSEIYPGLRVEDYKKQFNMLYGAIFLMGDTTDEIKSNIIRIEKNRLSNNTQDYSVSPMEFVKQYSGISFFMAKERCFEKTVYAVAVVLKDVFSSFLDGDNLTKQEMQLLKKEISEIILDLKYASGMSDLCSLRMKPLVQQNTNI